MGKTFKIVTILFLCLFLLTIICSFNYAGQIVQKNDPNGRLSIRLDSNINIHSNAEFTLYAFQGNGSAGNPYIIKNKVIDSSAINLAAIYIEDTNAYFRIQNCTILKTKAGYNGIRLNNVTHGKIINCSIKNSGQDGICLTPNCINNTITENTISNSTAHGINILRSCHYNNFTANTISKSTENGIIINNSCNYNIISFNTVYSSKTFNGIHLWNYCSYNQITGNNISFNPLSGIVIELGGVGNSVINNTVQQNGASGISLDSVTHTRIELNKVSANTDGIRLTSSHNNTLVGNTANANGDRAIYLLNCHNNTLNDNTAFGNSHSSCVGIKLTNSDRNSLTNNILTYCYTGIYLSNADKNKLEYNHANYNIERGIWLVDSENNSLAYNEVKYNTKKNYAGIELKTSHNNTLRNNEVMHNKGENSGTPDYYNGIYLKQSNRNNLQFNTISNNTQNGIYLDNSSYNQIAYNTITSNLFNGIALSFAYYNIITQNTIKGNPNWAIEDFWYAPYINDPVTFPHIYLCKYNTIADNCIEGQINVEATFNAITNNSNCGIPGFQWEITIFMLLLAFLLQACIKRKRIGITPL
jgi:parallel beta-helix repeat protein